jgi:hypothetical protein
LFAPYIGTNINPPVSTNTAGAYARIPFNVSVNLSSIASLILKLRYDDGCIIYLNGAEVARRNFGTSTPSYTSVTVTPRSDASAIAFETVDLTAHKHLLVSGSNMLAIHIMNSTASFSATSGKDLLLQPRLEALISGQVILTQTTQVKARVRDNSGNWSPLTDYNFVVDSVPASASNIVVSELNYNPLPPTLAESQASGANNDNDFEFIEILNISNQSVDLTECSLEGVSFAWTSAPLNRQTLPPGGRMVIVENAAAFAARYAGKNAVVAGEFTGNLSNAGQMLTLRARNGSIIKSFTYDDAEPWPVDADGAGFTLVLNNSATNPNHAIGSNWRSSGTMHGCPGEADALTFGGLPTGDSDGDSIPDIVEYAVGSNAANGNQTRLPELGYEGYDLGNGPDTHLTFTFTKNLSADGIVCTPEVSSNLTHWDQGTVSLTYIGTTNNGDGSATTVWRSTQPVSALPNRLFARVSVTPAAP